MWWLRSPKIRIGKLILKINKSWGIFISKPLPEHQQPLDSLRKKSLKEVFLKLFSWSCPFIYQSIQIFRNTFSPFSWRLITFFLYHLYNVYREYGIRPRNTFLFKLAHNCIAYFYNMFWLYLNVDTLILKIIRPNRRIWLLGGAFKIEKIWFEIDGTYAFVNEILDSKSNWGLWS